MNTDLAPSKETLVTLAIEAFNNSQKKILRAAAIALGAQLTLHTNVTIAEYLELNKPQIARNLLMQNK
jgi:hypothetical protein